MSRYAPCEPDEEVDDADDGDEDHPEPQEEEDLLVVHVDGQHALHRVPVQEICHLEKCMICLYDSESMPDEMSKLY